MIDQVCFVEGSKRSTRTHSALSNTKIPVWTLLFAVVAGREEPTGRRFLALAASLTGVLLVVWPAGGIGLGRESLAGDLLTLAYSISFAAFLVMSRDLLLRTVPLAATAVLMSFGAAGIFFVGVCLALRR